LEEFQVSLNFETVEDLGVSLFFIDLPNAELLLRAQTDESVCVREVAHKQYCFTMDGETTI
jgi:hypothetical protein